MTNIELAFLKESNRIDRVYVNFALQQAIYAWDYLDHQETLTPSVIKETHRRLMQGLVKEDDLGVFRHQDVYIHGIKAPLIGTIENLVSEWCGLAMTETNENSIHYAHVTFEHIHPFFDGNGRVGRMLMLWLRKKAGLDPYIIYKENVREYYTEFRRKPYPKNKAKELEAEHNENLIILENSLK